MNQCKNKWYNFTNEQLCKLQNLSEGLKHDKWCKDLDGLDSIAKFYGLSGWDVYFLFYTGKSKQRIIDDINTLIQTGKFSWRNRESV